MSEVEYVPGQARALPKSAAAAVDGGAVTRNANTNTNMNMNRSMNVENVSPLSCPICAPQRSCDDADFLYYPADEEIPVSLCKHVYGYPRDLHENYELLEEIGKGSFGVVTRAVQRTTGDFFAVKTVPKSRPTWTGGMDGGMREATTSAYLLKIQNEVNFLARLGDVEEIVQLKKAYEDDSHVHLVMDLCTGGSLFDKIESFQERDNHAGDGHFEHFTEERVRLIMRRVLHMILKCHRRGIIYRDIKPQNFLYVDDTPSSDIKCSDYGLAMTYIPDNPEGLLLTKRAGTPAYMAPEVVLRRYNEKADLWGAGMLMYQLLAGRFPFWGGGLSISSTMDDIFFDILIRNIDFDFIADMASPEAADLCRNLLARDPKIRMTVAEAAEHPWLALG